MRAAFFLLLLPATVFADAATPTAAVRGDRRADLTACSRRFERRFSNYLRGEGAIKVMADADPPQVQFRFTTERKQVMVAAVLASDGSPRSDWERDDQWNYPIDPTIAWRERRSLPDLQGAVIVYHDPHGDQDFERKWFVTVAKLAVDDCMAMTRWTAPEGTLSFRTVGGMFDENFSFDPSGAASIWRATDGGSIGEMATVSGRETAALFNLIRTHHLCEPRVTSEQPIYLTLTVDAPGLGCTVRLPEDSPIRAPVEKLRDQLFPHRVMGRNPT
jgi:hypothetical protein